MCSRRTYEGHRFFALSLSRFFAFFLVAAFASPGSVRADGFMVIDRPPLVPGPPHPVSSRVAWFPLEVRNHNVTCDIRDTVGVTRIDQVFHNPNPQQMEGTYLFPLPETASVQKFSMWMSGKEVGGEILDADKARRIYEDIVRRMRDPALLEYVGGRVYKARVFPIPARGDVRIKLEYSETLAVNDGLAVYRYPLNTEKFSAKPIEDVTVVVNLKSAVALKNVYCPSHSATVSRPNDNEARVGFEAHHVKPDQDFLVYYQMSDKDFGLSLLSHRPGGEDGFFMARIAPPVIADSAKIVPKDVCFVFDTSGSMAGEKIAQARRAMKFCLSSLRPDDRFNVISFATEVRPFRETLVPANRENIDAALALVDKTEAAGGTAIHEALLSALRPDRRPAGQDRPYMIVFITDGEPTIGERDPATIQAAVAGANEGRCRLFVFGVGHDLNTKLLDRLAEDNRGARDYIDEKEDIEVRISSFFRKVADPVLGDIAIRFGDADTFDVYPKQLPDLFHGGELVVVGRYRKPGRTGVTIDGRRAGERMTWQYPAVFADGSAENDFLPRLWATRRIGYLMDEIRLHGETAELKDEILRLARRYAIITPYTSYLIVEDGARPHVVGTPAVPAAQVVRRIVAGDASNDRAISEARLYGQANGGVLGVRASKEASDLKVSDAWAAGSHGWAAGVAGQITATSQAGPAEPLIRPVGGKTFYFDNGRWTDSEYDGKAPAKKVRAFSDDYFELLRATPELGKYLALGSRVVLVLGKAVYEIDE